MQRIAIATTLTLSAVLVGPQLAEAQVACSLYPVQQGDTLREIARAAYGDNDFRRIWNANRDVIGRNPNVVAVGSLLQLPCEDGSLPDAPPVPAVIASGGSAATFVTANGYLPYTGETAGNRGLFTHLVTSAMVRAAPGAAFEVVFINDWAAHVETLLPRQAFDASFPWTRPGCETQGVLTEVERYACANFVYSDPFYEIVEGFFARTGSAFGEAMDPSQLAGSTICRPEGYPTGHLEELGLMTSDTRLVQPVGTARCFELLVAGHVDVVALDTRAGELALDDLGLDREVSENRHLHSILPLRVALHKDNPRTEELLHTLNMGLRIMLESGEWAAIVSESLREQTAQLVN